MESLERNARAQRWILHPALFAAAPLLMLYSHNRDSLDPQQLLVPLAAALASVCAAWWVAWYLLGPSCGALIASAIAVALFSFGHVRQAAEVAFRMRFGEYEDGMLSAALALALVWAGLRLARWNSIPGAVHSALNLTGLILVLFSAAAVLPSIFRSHEVPVSQIDAQRTDDTYGSDPDIYYIVLDGYGRSDVVRELFGYDNSRLLRALSQQGFVVAEGSHANYSQTLFSLASTLNLQYLDELGSLAEPGSTDRRPVTDMVRESFLARYLKERGYRTVAFETGYRGTELRDADLYLVPEPSLSEFEIAALELTPLGALARSARTLDAVALHRRRVLFAFHHLPVVARAPGPKLVFAHIVAPHPPFVFREDGSPATTGRAFRMQDGSHFMRTSSRESYIEGYRAQISFLSTLLERTLNDLIASSETPPVIIVQGDHGPGAWLDHESVSNTNLVERMSILNAYYLPGADPTPIYPSISPVNSFRVVLNRYFGAGLPLLPDRSYFATWSDPYRFVEVTDAMPGRD